MQFRYDEEFDLWYDSGDRGEARANRWKRRDTVQRLARQDRERGLEETVFGPTTYCGKAVEDVELRVHRGRGFAAKVMTCGKIWVCPTCSLMIRTRRQVELAVATQRHVSSGGRLAMITLTVRHSGDMSLSQTLDAISEGWRLVTNRVGWRKLRGHLSGFVRAVEITYGENGWHPHLHVLLFVKPGTSDEVAESFNAMIFEAWSVAAEKALRVSPSIDRGFDFVWFGQDHESAAAYVTKAAKELTQAGSKSGRDPFGLLDEPTESNLDLFREYAMVTHRRKAISWSLKLRAVLGMQAEAGDEEVAVIEAVGECVRLVDASWWNRQTVWNRLRWLEFVECEVLVGSSA